MGDSQPMKCLPLSFGGAGVTGTEDWADSATDPPLCMREGMTNTNLYHMLMHTVFKPYCFYNYMVGNFRGVLILWLTWLSRKIPFMKINAL